MPICSAARASAGVTAGVLLLVQAVDEMLDLARVGCAEALRKMRHDIVGDASTGQRQHGRLAQIADLKRPLRADDLAIECRSRKSPCG